MHSGVVVACRVWCSRVVADTKKERRQLLGGGWELVGGRGAPQAPEIHGISWMG